MSRTIWRVGPNASADVFLTWEMCCSCYGIEEEMIFRLLVSGKCLAIIATRRCCYYYLRALFLEKVFQLSNVLKYLSSMGPVWGFAIVWDISFLPLPVVCFIVSLSGYLARSFEYLAAWTLRRVFYFPLKYLLCLRSTEDESKMFVRALTCILLGSGSTCKGKFSNMHEFYVIWMDMIVAGSLGCIA